MDDKRSGKLSEAQFYAMLHILMKIKKAKEQFTNNFILPQCLTQDHIEQLMKNEDEDAKDDWDGLFLSNNTTSEIVRYYNANQSHQRSSTVQSSASSVHRVPNGQRSSIVPNSALSQASSNRSNGRRQSSVQRSSQMSSNGNAVMSNASSGASSPAGNSQNLDSVQNWADFSFDQW